MNVLKPILTNLFMENTYACVEGRGPHKASRKCAEFTRRYKYCLKCDIRKFYPSINQKILSGMFHRIIKDDRFMSIVDDIIFSFEGETNCPIGNYCSQWFGNFYLSAMDNYILHILHCGSYMRYCDDFILFSNNKVKLKEWKDGIKDFISDNLNLEFSKAEIFPTSQGVDYCGYRHYKKYILLRKSTAKRIKRRFKKIESEMAGDSYDVTKIRGQLASAKGQLKHCCSHNLKQSIKLDELTTELIRKESKK